MPFHSKSLRVELTGKVRRFLRDNSRNSTAALFKENGVFQGKVAKAMKFYGPRIGLLHRNCVHDI